MDVYSLILRALYKESRDPVVVSSPLTGAQGKLLPKRWQIHGNLTPEAADARQQERGIAQPQPCPDELVSLVVHTSREYSRQKFDRQTIDEWDKYFVRQVFRIDGYEGPPMRRWWRERRRK